MARARSHRRSPTTRPPQRSLAPARRPLISWPVLIVAAGSITYANSLSTPFLFDDFGSIVRNPQIRDLWDLGRIVAPPDATSVAGRPLANFSFAVNYAVGGLDPTGYHVVSVALHILCGLLVFGLVRRTLDRVWHGAEQALPLRSEHLAVAVALLWVVHPLNSEVVVYLSERTESMMTACYLWTLYAGVRAHGSRRPAPWLASAVASCAAGMACKESMASVPLMLLVYDRVFLFDSIREAFGQRWRFYAGLAACWIFLAALIATHGDVSSGGFETATSSTWNYLLNQTVVLTRYFHLVVWPRPLVLYYGWVKPLTLAEVWPYAVFVVGLLAATIAVFVRRPKLGFLGIWVFIALGPSSSFAPIAAEVGAERRMYLPLVAIVTMAVLGVAWLTDRLRLRRSAAAALCLATAAALSASTILRNQDYRSSFRMAETVLAGWPSPSAHQLLGQELAAIGRHDEAIDHLREAARGAPPARYFLGMELVAVGRFDEAIPELEAFVREESRLPVVPSARILIGRAHAASRRWPQAIEQARQVLAGNPSHADAHGLMAEGLMAEQRFAEAAVHYRAFVAARAQDAGGWTGLGVALMSSGNGVEAIEAFRRAVDLDGGSVVHRQNLARALLARGDVDGAVDQVRQAAVLNPNDPAAHEMFGRVLASQNRFDEARRELERTLDLDPQRASAREALRSLPVRR